MKICAERVVSRCGRWHTILQSPNDRVLKAKFMLRSRCFVHLFEVKQGVVELFVDAFELVRLVGVVGRFEFGLLIFVHIVTPCKLNFAAYRRVLSIVIITCRTDAVKPEANRDGGALLLAAVTPRNAAEYYILSIL